MIIKIQCPSCYKTFDNLPNLNRHIGKTSHNGGNSINVDEFLKCVGIKQRYSTSS